VISNEGVHFGLIKSKLFYGMRTSRGICSPEILRTRIFKGFYLDVCSVRVRYVSIHQDDFRLAVKIKHEQQFWYEMGGKKVKS